MRAPCASVGAGVRTTVIRDTVTSSILINAIVLFEIIHRAVAQHKVPCFHYSPRALNRLRAPCASAGAGVRTTVIRNTVTTSILINAIVQVMRLRFPTQNIAMLARLFEINKVTGNS